MFSGQKQTPDELKQVRQARTDYQDYLSKVQTNTKTDVNTNRLTPESGQQILQEVKKAYDWLQKNPNAQFGEVLANQDATTVEIKRINSTDKPKNELKNTFTSLPTIAEELFAKKALDKTQVEQLKELAAQEEKWYKKNAATATEIQFSQEQIKIQDQLVSIVPDKDSRQYFLESLNKAKTLSPGDLASLIQKTETDIQQRKSQQVDIQEGTDIILSTALKVFFSCLLIGICILSGSLAANHAIAREPIYRAFYFFYGAFPLFVPFVFLYTIYRRLYEGPFSYYGILPISTEPATTRFGKLLWYPFYWIPDSDSVKAYDNFNLSVKTV